MFTLSTAPTDRHPVCPPCRSGDDMGGGVIWASAQFARRKITHGALCKASVSFHEQYIIYEQYTVFTLSLATSIESEQMYIEAIEARASERASASLWQE